ncbi:hypothetical protein MMC14_003746, partial [Varicellaria rhodocarpa]|nr:hypothetical protein [Varicellaria rhodocarpa]
MPPRHADVKTVLGHLTTIAKASTTVAEYLGLLGLSAAFGYIRGSLGTVKAIVETTITVVAITKYLYTTMTSAIHRMMRDWQQQWRQQ